MTRTAAILAAIQHQLDARRQLLDGSDDLGELVVTVKLDAGTAVIRSTCVSELHVFRRQTYTRAEDRG